MFEFKQKKIEQRVNDSFRSSAPLRPAPVYHDPLAIDLAGDGIQTIGIGAAPVLFDHDADGIRTGTGWLSGQDAWLVLDRDGSGSIDSGRELFGVDYVKSDGQLASSGFDALRDLDANGDNVFDSADAAYTQVRLWQDLDQDGISQSNELFTLEDKNIAAIALSPTTATTNLGNGNAVSAAGTVTRSDASTTTAGAVDLNLATNPFYRDFTDAIALSEAASTLPEMQGAGWVRDLREAMSLGSAASAALTAQVQQFAQAGTKAEQMALLDDLLRLWGQTNQAQSMGAVNDPQRRFVLNGDAMTSAKLQWAIPILEVFNGMGVDAAGMQAPTTSTGADGQPVLTYSLFANQAPGMLAAYDALKDSVYSALVVQTRLKPYLDAIELVVDEGGVRFDTAGLGARLESVYAASGQTGVEDLVDLNRYAAPTLAAVGFDVAAQLRPWVEALPAGSALRALLPQLDVFVDGATTGSARSDIYIGNAAANSFSAGAGADVLDGGEGADVLYGGADNDVLNGGAGVDNLYGEAGDDVFDGGAGNDAFNGGVGNNTYHFGRGGGQDIVVTVLDNTVGKLNTLKLGPDITADQVLLRTAYSGTFGWNSDLEVGLVGSTDKITFSGGWRGAQGNNDYATLQRIEFADGTVWGLDAIRERMFAGTAGNDVYTGTAGADTLLGLGGADVIDGSAGADAIDGGEGADVLIGGTGNDTYRLGLGYGADTVQENDATAGNTDALSFGAGIAAEQVWLRRSGNNLEVSLIGTGDKATISNWYLGSQYHVEQFQTADGRMLLDSQVQGLVDAMAAFAPPAPGQTTLPADYQASLQPLIAANWT